MSLVGQPNRNWSITKNGNGNGIFFNLRTHPRMAATSPDSLQDIGGKNFNWHVKIQLKIISFHRQEVGLTCQCTLWFWAGNSTLEISQVTWKLRGESSQFVSRPPSFMTHLCVNPPDFSGELNTCFDDKGSVRVHGHTRLSLNNKCTAIRQEHHRKHHWSDPVSLVFTVKHVRVISNLFIRLRKRSTIFSSRAGRCWIIGSPLYETFCWSSSSFLICCLICNCDSAKEVILKGKNLKEGIKKGGIQNQDCLWTDCIPCL